jgi:predicted sulfurtransferase
MFGKVLINVSRDLKMSLYLGTNFIFDERHIIRDGRSISIEI